MEIKTSFVWAKGRVSPIKKITIPRLELLGAVIAVRMAKYLKGALDFKNVDIKFWCDSTIVLYWIKGYASKWKPFVANRVIEIQSLSDPENWNHCIGKENPSDFLTRGEKLSTLLNNNLWWKGPPWLSLPKNVWAAKIEINSEESCLEERKSKPKIRQLCCTIVGNEYILKLENFSKISRVYRITAWILRFANNINKEKPKISGPLTTAEIEKTEKYWIQKTQENSFKDEIYQLKHRKEIYKESPLFSLRPEFDEDKLLVLKGRLQFSDLNAREKHPWILPYKNKFVELLIIDAHERLCHFGVSSTLAHLREKYFIIKGRRCVKSVLKTCLVCRRYNTSAGKEMIAPLPRDRIIETPPFETSGIDFAGPLFIKSSAGSEKSYILIFTCATTRAIHLELVSNLSTVNFILALRRFVSRRGFCRTIYSDNAKTFVKADAILKEIWSKISNQEVSQYFASNNIIWKFIVPRAPWWGGFWERMVRSVKTPLRKILGRTCLSYEEMETVLIEIEAIVNSRPLTYLDDDINEALPLTPAHFLVRKRLTSLPDGVPVITGAESNKRTLTKKLKYREQLIKHFWKRWRKEYLMQLRSANFISPSNGSSSIKLERSC